MEPIITKIEIKLTHSNGTFQEMSDIVPHSVAQEIACLTISWKENFGGTFKDCELDLNAIKNFKETLKNKKL